MFSLFITFPEAALCPLPFSYHRAPLNMVSSSLYPLIGYLISTATSPLSFFSRLNKSCSLSLSLYIMCSSPKSPWCSSAGFVPVCLSCSGMPKTEHNTPGAASHLLKLASLAIAAQDATGLLCYKEVYTTHSQVQLGVHQGFCILFRKATS